MQHRCPGCLAPMGRDSQGSSRLFLAFPVMATSFLSSPASVEIRQLVLHRYPSGIKAASAERIAVFYGRRGRPVKKPVSCQLSWPIRSPASCRPAGSAPPRCSKAKGLWALGPAPVELSLPGVVQAIEGNPSYPPGCPCS